jgi:hypothetical protein
MKPVIENIPENEYGQVLSFHPAKVTLARTVDATISTTTEITLNTDTTWIEVTARAHDVYLKWGTADVTASNFDEIIGVGESKAFAVPIDLATGALFTAINVIERVAGATVIVIEK